MGSGSPTHAASNLPLFFGFEVSPSRLSQTNPTPARLRLSGGDWIHANEPAAAMRGLQFQLDKRFVLDVKGIPNVKGIPGCMPGRSPRRAVGAVRKACAPAVVGNGRIGVEVRFPGQPPVPVESEVVILNGGVAGRTTTLYVYAFFSAPVTAAVSIPVKVRKVDEERFGWKAVVTVPKIAGGSGSIASYSLRLQRRVVAAICDDGKHEARALSAFADGFRMYERVIRPCTARS
jgi:hypothetical protein